jgi:hypothetical protein
LVFGAIIMSFPEHVADQQTARFFDREWNLFLRECVRQSDPVVGRQTSLRPSSSTPRRVGQHPLRNFTIP